MYTALISERWFLTSIFLKPTQIFQNKLIKKWLGSHIYYKVLQYTTLTTTYWLHCDLKPEKISKNFKFKKKNTFSFERRTFEGFIRISAISFQNIQNFDFKMQIIKITHTKIILWLCIYCTILPYSEYCVSPSSFFCEVLF